MNQSLIFAATLAAAFFSSGAVAQDEVSLRIDDTDAGLVQRDVQENPAFAWSSLAVNAFPRSRPGGNWVGTKYFLIGGELDTGQFGFNRADTVEIFDGATGTWSNSNSLMPVPVSNIMGSTAVAGNEIFVFGGYNTNSRRSAKVQAYNVVSDTWRELAVTYPGGGLYGCLAVNAGNGQIFVCGGNRVVGETADAFFFDPVTEVFTATTAMPAARYHVTGDRDRNTIYAAAGFNTGTTLEAFDVPSATWTSLPNLPNDRAGCGVAAVGRYCVFFGGDWSLYRSDADVYDSFTGTYNPTIAASLGDMPTGRRAFAYGTFKSLTQTAFTALDGWAGGYLEDCAVIF